MRSEVQQLVRSLSARRAAAVGSLRPLRRELSKLLMNAPPSEVREVAAALIDQNLRWLAYELIYHHRPTREGLGRKDVELLGASVVSWGDADAFAAYIAGPAWLNRQISDAAVRSWTRSDNRWWRRIALAATTVLNTKTKGGRGDAIRTLAVAETLRSDGDDMVVKALSWSLRSLVPWDARAVQEFMTQHSDELAARVVREVNQKLRTGRKAPRPKSRG